MRLPMCCMGIIPCLHTALVPERPLKWQRRQWKASVWDYAKSHYSWCRTTWLNNGQVISYGYIQEQISLRQRKRILNPPTVRNFVPVLQQVIMMPLLSGIHNLKKFLCRQSVRLPSLSAKLKKSHWQFRMQRQTRESVIPSNRWKRQKRRCRQDWRS